MKNTLKLIVILLLLIGVLILGSYNYNLKKVVSKVKQRDYVGLNKSDIFNLYSFLETKYNNILLPKKIIFREDKNNKHFICENLRFMSNNNEQNIKLKFIPIKDNSFVTKYLFFNRYGNFEIINENINDDVPNISHLSSDLSEELNEETPNKEIDNSDLNFDVNDIIASETDNIFIENKNINNKLSKEDLEYNNSDTENDTTESIIDKALI